ncbi:MAG: hypothetical protein CVV27_15545 [Candidatus Melainabacteria bacterium HGW-Melainabacteria-1]|nr:MAG: hypothetical protein CVV27_15545 [Candidatus Melainabacteria bacterium HGW-Melainabacteria-1]
MTDKSIWKKTLSWFVEIDDGQVKPVDNPENMESVMAQTRKSMQEIDQDPPAEAVNTTVSSVVSNFVPKEEVRAVLVDQNSRQDAPDFSALYDSVSKSNHSVYKVEEILAQPELQNLPKETRAKAAAVALRAMGSSVEEVIQDAYLKDQALDQAELLQRQLSHETKQRNEARIGEIQQEVDQFLKAKNTEIEALREENYQSDQQLHQWVEAKLQEKKRLFQILSHFVADDSANITLGEMPGGAGR